MGTIVKVILSVIIVATFVGVFFGNIWGQHKLRISSPAKMEVVSDNSSATSMPASSFPGDPVYAEFKTYSQKTVLKIGDHRLRATIEVNDPAVVAHKHICKAGVPKLDYKPLPSTKPAASMPTTAPEKSPVTMPVVPKPADRKVCVLTPEELETIITEEHESYSTSYEITDE